MEKKKVVAIIQARMGATRLPDKVLKKIVEETLLEILIKRIKQCKLVDEIMVATTHNEKDMDIVKMAEHTKIRYYRGDEEDVLKRYVDAAVMTNADIIVRVTADNPLTDPELVDNLIEMHLKSNADYTYCEDVPLGVSAEIVTKDALEKIASITKSKSDREHVTIYIKMHPENFKIKKVETGVGYTNFRLTVDTKEDLELMRKIYENFGEIKKLKTTDVINFLIQNPEIRKINAHIKQKEP